MVIFVMRHGRTVWNEKGIVQGFSMNRLSKSGKQMIEDASRNFENEKIDLIFVSPLMRTVQTANILNKRLHAKIVKDSRLTELGKGVLEGRLKSTITKEERAIYFADKKKYGLETVKSLFDRVNDFLNQLKRECSTKRVLVVTHGAVASMFVKIATYKTYHEELFADEIDIKNAQIIKLEI